MQYLVIPLAIVVTCFCLGIYFLSQKSMTVLLRMGLGVFFLLVSHGVVALVIYIYKEIEDNSYYAAAVGTLLEEINESPSGGRAWFRRSFARIHKAAAVDLRKSRQLT